MSDLIKLPTSRFLKVKCPDCSNEQTLFDRASTEISCQACGHVLGKPTGGKLDLSADIVEELK